jgi:N-methylhydantoinase B
MSVDLITTEIIRATFIAAAERMRITMIKTAYSHIISESLDFGCAIFGSDVQMIAQGTGIPAFQGHLGFPIQATIESRGLDQMHPGDVFLYNDPYVGNGNHLNDVAMFAPVFWQDQLVGWVATKAHWSDIGGAVPGSLQVGSTNIYQEGLRFRGIKLYCRGEINEDVMRMIEANIRLDAGGLKDMNAMVAVCRVGDTSFKEILEKYGLATVKAATTRFIDQSEKRTRAAIRNIPSGSYRASGCYDNDGINVETPVRIEVLVTVDDGDMTVDCTGTSPQVEGPFNCGYAISVSICRLVLKCLTTPLDPVDEGCFKPLRVIIPPGSVLSVQEPAPTSRYAIPVVLLTELVLKALSTAIPNRIAAGSFADQMPVLLSGAHPVDGKLFVQGDLCGGGTGARPNGDGESGLSVFIGSTARNNPVEVVESRNPSIRILKFGLRQDSGGVGKFRGGLGTERVYRFDAPAFGTLTLERSVTPPWGLNGGGDGGVNQLIHAKVDGRSDAVRKVTRRAIAPGDTLVVRSGGGGGYGDPAERDPDAIQRDLAEGYISEDAARTWRS